MDCGHCDFCCDKPKFGGSNQKRQKCRWRQCLQFAMVGVAGRVWWVGEIVPVSPSCPLPPDAWEGQAGLEGEWGQARWVLQLQSGGWGSGFTTS